jgi:membrane protein implicated in regulation of membrane protease activity
MLWQMWWVWGVAALALAILEVLAPGYLFLGFAIGAAATGILLLAGGPFAAWLGASLPLLLLFFALCSLASWIALRRVLGVRKGQVKVWERDINDD